MISQRRQLSLLWKILLSTSIFITLLLGMTAWFVQDQMLRVTSDSLESGMQSSFRAYQSLWQSRAEMLLSVSLVLSNMSDVRAAFGTKDQATIRDTATEIWQKISTSNAFFLVTDPRGLLIASLGGSAFSPERVAAVPQAERNFPAQTAGFVLQSGHLFQMVITPVYVESGPGRSPGLLNVLAAGYLVDNDVAYDLKRKTGDSDFVFVVNHTAAASTLPADLSARFASSAFRINRFERIELAGSQYAVIATELTDPAGLPLGNLLIVRSFEAARKRIANLQANLLYAWLCAILAGLAGSYLFARRLLDPVSRLDRAAARIARQEYDTRVPQAGDDELGRLAQTFNAMCESIQQARAELIRQERISTIGRLSSSIVHDLRNPLAAIYGGAEMLMDGESELSEAQVKRLAANIYRASRAVKDLLQELVDVSRQKAQPAETCRLRDIVSAAISLHAAQAEAQRIAIENEIPADIELPLERARIERVFLNLISNALDAMPHGGTVRVSASQEDHNILVKVEDTGPGIPLEVRPILFQPFATSGKKNGLGLGLALSRQTVLDHGGDLWADDQIQDGARFWVKLPV